MELVDIIVTHGDRQRILDQGILSKEAFQNMLMGRPFGLHLKYI
jgi:hypothetical protein